jgi:hypothetical protein
VRCLSTAHPIIARTTPRQQQETKRRLRAGKSATAMSGKDHYPALPAPAACWPPLLRPPLASPLNVLLRSAGDTGGASFGNARCDLTHDRVLVGVQHEPGARAHGMSRTTGADSRRSLTRRRSWPVWIKRASGLRYWLAWGARSGRAGYPCLTCRGPRPTVSGAVSTVPRHVRQHDHQ